MPSKSNHIKSEFLGMPVGTAQGRLRKNIMYTLVKRAGLDKCYVCEETIESVKDFSIEHKIPWLHNDRALFWDLDNIAFSHLSCNSSSARRPLRERTHCSKGHLWDEKNTLWVTDQKGYRYRECRVCDLKRWHKRKKRANRDKRIKRLHTKGLSLRQIACKTNVSHVTVKNVLDKSDGQ